MLKLDTRAPTSFFGAVLAVFVSFILYVLLPAADGYRELIMGGVLFTAVVVIYIVATRSVKSDKDTESSATGMSRGLLIGSNSVANFGLIWLLLGVFSATAALVVASTVGLLGLLASIGPVSRWSPYKVLLGWGNWIMPMSWLVVGLGLVFTLFSLLVHLLLTTPFGVEFTRIGIKNGPLAGKYVKVDGVTGTIFVHGGLVANLNRLKTAFNMGNFSFVHYKSGASHILHEAGHTLNLAAFGSLFHLIGAVDEIWARGKAFAELLAESNDSSGSARLLMWAG